MSVRGAWGSPAQKAGQRKAAAASAAKRRKYNAADVTSGGRMKKAAPAGKPLTLAEIQAMNNAKYSKDPALLHAMNNAQHSKDPAMIHAMNNARHVVNAHLSRPKRKRK